MAQRRAPIPNTALRSIRENERCQTREELARDLVEAGDRTGLRVSCDARLIARWESGEVQLPRPVYRRLLSLVTGKELDQLGFAVRRPEPDEAIGPGSTIDVDPIGRAIDGGEFANTLRFPLPDLCGSDDFSALRLDRLASFELDASDGRAPQVGRTDVEAVREIIVVFRKLDNLYGAGYLRGAVVGFLHGDVGNLLRHGRCESETRESLFSAAAELTHLAGWMAYDAEDHPLARRYLRQALEFSRVAGDRAFGGEVLAGMSHQELYLGRAESAADLAAAAAAVAARVRLPALEAEAALMEAHACALMADGAAASRALRRAELKLHRQRTDPPRWLAYLDDAYLAAQFAQTFRDLGRLDLAEPHAVRSLQMDGNYVRGRAFNTVVLASVSARRGEVDRAVEIAKDALTLSSELRSARMRRYVHGLAEDLAPYATLPQVRELRHRVAEM